MRLSSRLIVDGARRISDAIARIAALLASGQMAVAYFWQHQPMGLWPIVPPEYGGNGGLSPILFCFVFFLLVFTGPGPYSVDRLRTRTSTG